MTIHNPKTVRTALKSRGNLEGMQFARIYQYRSDDGRVQFSLFNETKYDDMNQSQYVHDPVLLFDYPNLTEEGRAFLRDGP